MKGFSQFSMVDTAMGHMDEPVEATKLARRPTGASREADVCTRCPFLHRCPFLSERMADTKGQLLELPK